MEEITINVFPNSKWFNINVKFNYLFKTSKRNSDINRIARKFLICPQTIVQAQDIESSSKRVLGLFYTSNLHSDATEIRRTKQGLGQCFLPGYSFNRADSTHPGLKFLSCNRLLCFNRFYSYRLG